jgi:signal peptidase II
MGGAASNLFDILRYRSVINYIDLGWWPVFNLTDIAMLAA